MLSDALSLGARWSKCIPYVLRCALARRLSIQMHPLCAHMRSRSTLVDPNAFPTCSNELSPDACLSKCVSIGPAPDDTNLNGTDGLLSIHTNHDSRAFICLSMFVSQNDELLAFSSRSASKHFGTTRTPYDTNQNGTNGLLSILYPEDAVRASDRQARGPASPV